VSVGRIPTPIPSTVPAGSVVPSTSQSPINPAGPGITGRSTTVGWAYAVSVAGGDVRELVTGLGVIVAAGDTAAPTVEGELPHDAQAASTSVITTTEAASFSFTLTPRTSRKRMSRS